MNRDICKESVIISLKCDSDLFYRSTTGWQRKLKNHLSLAAANRVSGKRKTLCILPIRRPLEHLLQQAVPVVKVVFSLRSGRIGGHK